MAIYVGETVTIVCAAVNPLDDTVIADATAHVDFFAPGKNPAKVPADRTVDQGPFSMAYDSSVVNKDGSTGAYVAYVPTDATWHAGKWSYRVKLAGAYDTWEFGTFSLVA